MRRVLGRVLPGLLAAGLPFSTNASVSASLSWNASSDTNVTGYNIYYGTASHQYTNTISVGNATSVVIPGLTESTTYFFAATSHDSAGNESAFSNEAAFAGLSSVPGAKLKLKTVTNNATSDRLTFSLDATAPAGASINRTNGVFSWTVGTAYASTTNAINVIVTDTVNAALSLTETMVVTISDFLDIQVGTAAGVVGQTNTLPLTVAASSTVTNMQIILNWPGQTLLNPTLTFVKPITSGSLQNQNGQLVLQLRTKSSSPFSGTNQVAKVNFQTAPGQASTIFSVPVAAASGKSALGVGYANVVGQPGEVVVVGANPLLQPQANASQGRTLSLYAAPGTYQLQYATSLAAPINWTPLMTYQQTNAAQIVSLDSANPVVFYRLQQL